ncbi:MAG: cyclase family protein, partial [Candidatus Heimdallarchaeota archaeon]
HTAVGTYLDVPFHRFADGKDISQFDLSDFILEGIIVDASSDNKNNAILSAIESSSMKGKALLIYFGKGSEWGTEAYYTYPALTQDEIDQIAASKVKLVGVDTINIDDSSRYHRPAHTKFLSNNILIVENLTNLDKILNKKFRLFAVPLNIPKVPNMPVRVFAEVY